MRHGYIIPNGGVPPKDEDFALILSERKEPTNEGLAGVEYTCLGGGPLDGQIVTCSDRFDCFVAMRLPEYRALGIYAPSTLGRLRWLGGTR